MPLPKWTSCRVTVFVQDPHLKYGCLTQCAMALSTEPSEESTRQTETAGMTTQTQDAANSSTSFGGSSWGIGDSAGGSQVQILRLIMLGSGGILMEL